MAAAICGRELCQASSCCDLGVAVHADDETPTPLKTRRQHRDETLKMHASTEEERSRTLEIEEPSTPATPAPDVAERLKLAGNGRELAG